MTKMLNRLMNHVQPEPNSGCWLWISSVHPNPRHGGYGKFNVNGKVRPAHRVAYELLKGPIPNGLELDHLCRVRCCVNPDHLEPVTHKVNTGRGVSAVMRAKQAAKITHCPAGHEYAGSNLYISKSGYRSCIACKRRGTQMWRERQKVAKGIK